MYIYGLGNTPQPWLQITSTHDLEQITNAEFNEAKFETSIITGDEPKFTKTYQYSIRNLVQRPQERYQQNNNAKQTVIGGIELNTIMLLKPMTDGMSLCLAMSNRQLRGIKCLLTTLPTKQISELFNSDLEDKDYLFNSQNAKQASDSIEIGISDAALYNQMNNSVSIFGLSKKPEKEEGMVMVDEFGNLLKLDTYNEEDLSECRFLLSDMSEVKRLGVIERLNEYTSDWSHRLIFKNWYNLSAKDLVKVPGVVLRLDFDNFDEEFKAINELKTISTTVVRVLVSESEMMQNLTKMDEVTQALYDDETLQGKQVNWQILLGSNMLCSVEDFKNAEFRQASFLKIAEEPIWASDLELKDNESEDDFCDIGTYVIKQLLAVGSEEDGNLQLPYIGKVFRFYSRYWWEH